jgi:hypothetical protein
MSNQVLIFIGRHQTFDVETVDHTLMSLSGWVVERLGPGIGALRQYLCTQEPRELMVRVSSDAETITIDGFFDMTSAALALSLQSALSSPLRVTDMGYNFDLLLGDFASAGELLSAASS